MFFRKKITLFLFVILSSIAVFSFFPNQVFAQLNFGGRVTLYMPICQTPPGTYLMTGPPVPMPLFWMPGTMFYSYGPPSPGRNILGKAGMGWIPCIIWVPCGFAMCPVVLGGGFPMLFNGSSAI